MHIHAHAGHAFALRPTAQPIRRWPALIETWLHTIGILDIWALSGSRQRPGPGCGVARKARPPHPTARYWAPAFAAERLGTLHAMAVRPGIAT
jgi:hypothetical protein